VRVTRGELAKLSGLLDIVLDLPQHDRAAWLENLQEPFTGAKNIVRDLLAEEASGEHGDFLSSLPDLSAGRRVPTADACGEMPSGTRIGVYVIAREVGHGGMSTVWLARRTDALTDRMVALKLPHLHLRSRRFAERFARERDILAKLTHPNIARLYDAGISPEGQPYLAMEFIEGEGLMQYCEQQRLGLEGRLQVFLQVLDAVGYAHSLGIIHRDIKPSNILVRGGGQVMLLDFGIAKLLVGGRAEETELTQHGGAVLTIHYASPEQLKGDTLTAATDVYSLGVVLYELLCGRRPHESATLAYVARRAFEAEILAVDAEAPSDAVRRTGSAPACGMSPAKLTKALRGDLDTIVLKCLRKAPVERYESCAAFAEDLRRHLRHEPVTARPSTVWYRFRQLARRRRIALQGASIAALSVAAAASILIVMDRRHLSAPRDRPVPRDRQETSRAIAVLPFDNLSGNSANDYFTQGIQDEVLTRLDHISGLKVMSRNASSGFASQPDSLKKVSESLRVGSVLEGSVQEQGDRVRVNVRLVETAGDTTLWAESFDRPAKDIFAVERDVAEQVALRLQAKLLPNERAALQAIDTQNPEAHAADLWGRFYMSKRDDESLQKAVAHFNEAVRLDPNYAMAYADLSTAFFYIANSLDESDASSAKDQARRAAQRALALNPQLAEAHTAIGWVFLYFDWNISGAEREFALAYRSSPNSPRAKIGLANMYATFGDFDRAVTAMNEAQALDPLSSVVATDIAIFTLAQEKYDVAAAWTQKALELDQNAPYCHAILADIALARGYLAEAEREARLEPHAETKEFALTLVRQRSGNRSVADAALREFRRHHEKLSPYLVASVYAFRGDADAAFAWLDRAYRARDLGTIDFRGSPSFGRLRTDPRYRAFCKTLGVDRSDASTTETSL
jgi:serine/threonine protein kinase/Flp pilus assembly protein TadD